ncbi:MAG TPA: hypothetical protein VK680_00175 [Solirubrobacteraceae bacterium]|nr:hypothetical protein [Solirubrobacteraceae bacterium]
MLVCGYARGLGLDEVDEIWTRHPQRLSCFSSSEDLVVWLHRHGQFCGQVGDQSLEAREGGFWKRHGISVVAANEDFLGRVEDLGESSEQLEILPVRRSDDEIVGY